MRSRQSHSSFEQVRVSPEVLVMTSPCPNEMWITTRVGDRKDRKAPHVRFGRIPAGKDFLTPGEDERSCNHSRAGGGAAQPQCSS